MILIVFDLMISNYNDLPMHSVTGVLLTLVFWVICSTLGQDLSAAILVVPATFTIIFVLGVWVAKKSLQNRGCCVTCGTGGDMLCGDPPAPSPPAPEKPKPKCPPPKPKCTPKPKC